MHAVTKTPIDLGTSFTGALDSMPASAAAYSVARRLLTSYTGSLIRVRRSSDNAESDIGYVAAGGLDTATLLTFCGAGSGYITTTYDQSGNAKDRTQTTASQQARIVNAGVVEVDAASKPTAVYDGTDDYDDNTSVSAAVPLSMASVMHPTTASASYGMAIVLAAGAFEYRRFFTTDGFQAQVSPLLDISDAAGAFTRRQITIYQDSSTTYLRRNGSDIGNQVVRTAVDVMRVGNRTGGNSLWYGGSLSELILFASQLSAGDITALEANQIAYYGL